VVRPCHLARLTAVAVDAMASALPGDSVRRGVPCAGVELHNAMRCRCLPSGDGWSQPALSDVLSDGPLDMASREMEMGRTGTAVRRHGGAGTA
jgi:hypothetical protein